MKNPFQIKNEIEVDSYEEAVNLAKDLKNHEFHDFFRGQIQNWPVIPSSLRLSEYKRKLSANRLSRFIGWVENNFNLKNLHGKEDEQIAVAQHYRIATPL